ncbi:hypothetical protein [Neptunomonas qingdaonensis]|uniref:Uncharacterized protein n=1 Tax=Neptunomonas qingdaonensis TaxID=1045558 RepID=A0A1I2LQL1_9GAMM|nr:hypothetical protein [Neptunomonas qingdaonensis]SFF81545.1 hypothetical protein SAMN05216175_101193 [Neptunomonas qingdaonensis]
MISGISGASMAVFQTQSSSNSSSLSTDQRQLIEDTLAEFNVDQLTEADALSITETFADAGIQPGREMAQAMSDAGFDARTIGDLAGVGGPQQGGMQQGGTPPPPPSQGLNISDEMLQSLNDLLNDYYSGDLTEEEQASTLTSITDILKETAPEGGLINVTA